MKARLIAAVSVFVAGFVIGLGLTYMLLAKPPAEAGVSAPAEEAAAAESTPSAAAGAETAMPGPGKPLPSTDDEFEPEETPPTEKPNEKKWWHGLKGKTCKVNLGRAGALIVRQGGLQDGEVLDWMTQFGRNPRIGLISGTEEIRVLVHGVGVDVTDTPVAAMVTVNVGNDKKTGIIALHTQGLNVSLTPME